MTEKQRLKLKDGIQKMMDEKKPANMKKGIYIQSEPNLQEIRKLCQLNTKWFGLKVL